MKIHKMMDYSKFSVEELLVNESFINYCYDLNEEDVKHWENILNTEPGAVNNIEQAKELCLLLAVKVSPAEKVIQLEKLKQEVERSETYETVPETGRSKVRQLWIWASVAASFLILTTIYVSYRINAPVKAAVLYSAVTTNNYKLTAATDFNHRKTVVLPDGSKVIMNGSSTLRIAADYNVNDRHVLLEGEAFFYVKKNHAKPFVVLTGKTATTALGTSFKVQSYSSVPIATVMLATGKVRVESTQTNTIEEVILMPGQKATLSDNTTAFQKTGYNNTAITNWLSRKLVFSNSNLDDIVAKFKEIYGINIVTSNISPDKVMFTGQFNDKNPTEVLEAIGFSNHFTYTQSGSNVTLVF